MNSSTARSLELSRDHWLGEQSALEALSDSATKS